MVVSTPWFHFCFNFLSIYQFPKKILPLDFIQFSLNIPIAYSSGINFPIFSFKKKNFCKKKFCMFNVAMINFRLSAHHDFIFALIFCQYTNFQKNSSTQLHTIFFEYSNTNLGCHHATMLNILSEQCGHGQFSARMMQWWSSMMQQ